MGFVRTLASRDCVFPRGQVVSSLPPEMDPNEPTVQELDPRARRARSIILLLMAVLIVAPFVVWFLVERGAPKLP
jgi:hypothetical protein